MILVNDIHNLLPRKEQEYELFDVYKKNKVNRLIRVIRKIHLSTFLPLKGIWLGSWKKLIKNESTVIIFDFGNVEHIIKYILKKNRKCRVILWFWAPVSITKINLNNIKKMKCESWSFDEKDVLKYSMKYNTQFFCYSNLTRLKPYKVESTFDVFFVGTEKNRLNKLIEIKNILENYNISNYFHIVKSDSYYISNQNFEYKEYIKYEETLYLISKCKCILDLNSEEQVGLSLRPLEALFFKKKLITNQKSFINLDFYNKNNVFIIGIDDINSLKNFINSQYDISNQKMLEEKYCFASWIKRFNK